MKIGLIVDGEAEKVALPRQFYDTPVVRRGMNGRNVSLDQIAANSCRLISALEAANCAKILIVIDREDRQEVASIIKANLVSKIAACTSTRFEVVVADKMFENWLLSDIENISVSYPDKFHQTQNSVLFESTHGKSQFTSRLKPDISYRVSDTKEYFNKIRTSVAIVNSQSYSDWIDAIVRLGIPIVRRN